MQLRSHLPTGRRAHIHRTKRRCGSVCRLSDRYRSTGDFTTDFRVHEGPSFQLPSRNRIGLRGRPQAVRWWHRFVPHYNSRRGDSGQLSGPRSKPPVSRNYDRRPRALRVGGAHGPSSPPSRRETGPPVIRGTLDPRACLTRWEFASRVDDHVRVFTRSTTSSCPRFRDYIAVVTPFRRFRSRPRRGHAPSTALRPPCGLRRSARTLPIDIVKSKCVLR